MMKQRETTHLPIHLPIVALAGLVACASPAAIAPPITAPPKPADPPKTAMSTAIPDGSTIADICGWLDEAQKDFEARAAAFDEDHKSASAGFGTPPGAPGCEIRPIEKFAAKDPWRSVGVYDVTADAHQTRFTSLAIETNGWWAGPPIGRDVAIVATVRDVIPGGGDELVIEDTGGYDDGITICSREHRCAKRFELTGDRWEVAATFDGGKLVTKPVTGTPPGDHVGTFPLVFEAIDFAKPE